MKILLAKTLQSGMISDLDRFGQHQDRAHEIFRLKMIRKKPTDKKACRQKSYISKIKIQEKRSMGFRLRQYIYDCLVCTTGSISNSVLQSSQNC